MPTRWRMWARHPLASPEHHCPIERSNTMGTSWRSLWIYSYLDSCSTEPWPWHKQAVRVSSLGSGNPPDLARPRARTMMAGSGAPRRRQYGWTRTEGGVVSRPRRLPAFSFSLGLFFCFPAIRMARGGSGSHFYSALAESGSGGQQARSVCNSARFTRVCSSMRRGRRR